jgi:hypothetical protein
MRPFAQRFSKYLAGYPARILAVPLLMAGCLFFGCGKSDQQPGNANKSSSGNPVTAPVDYLGAVAQRQKRAMKSLDESGLNQSIQMFYAAEGRYPKDLKELVRPDYLSALPTPPAGMKFDYNPATGQVKVVPK